MMIVSDVNDVFVPLLDGFLVNAKEAKTVIERYVIDNCLEPTNKSNCKEQLFTEVQVNCGGYDINNQAITSDSNFLWKIHVTRTSLWLPMCTRWTGSTTQHKRLQRRLSVCWTKYM